MKYTEIDQNRIIILQKTCNPGALHQTDPSWMHWATLFLKLRINTPEIVSRVFELTSRSILVFISYWMIPKHTLKVEGGRLIS